MGKTGWRALMTAGRFDQVADPGSNVTQVATGLSASLIRLSEKSQGGEPWPQDALLL